jgi:glycosyltransferase involved in cell wall biosynthesis
VSPRRALVVAYYFPPIGGGGVTRSLRLVRALAAAGWSVRVLTVDDAAWARDESLVAEVPHGVSVLRLPNPDWGRVVRGTGGAPVAGRGGGRLARWLVPDLHVGWSALAALASGTFAAARAVDVVYTSAPPYSAHLAGWAARRLGVPWVADFRDAWIDNYDRQELPAWRVRIERALEARVLRGADRILFASDGARDRALAREPGLAARSETVHTGFDDAASCAHETRPTEVGRRPRPLELVHAGSVLLDGKAATLERLFVALRAWARAHPAVPDTVRVRFLGAEAGVAERIARAGLSPWVRAEPAVPRARVADELRCADACLHLAPPGALGGDPVPGKLFDAVGARRTLLSITPEGAVASLIRRLGLGLALDPARPDRIVNALEALRQAALRGETIAGPAPAARAALASSRNFARLVATLDEVARGPSRVVAWT